MANTFRIGLIIVLVGGLALQVASLTAYPPPHCDETYYTDTAYDFLTEGRFGTPVHGPVYGQDTNHTIIGRVYSIGLAGVIGLLGVSLTSARLYSLLGWLAAVLGTYLLGTRLYGRRTALWGALLFAVAFKTFFAAHLTRPEIWLAAATVWIFALLVPRAPEAEGHAGPGRALLLGVTAALLTDIHFNGAFFLAGLSLVVLYQWFWLPLRNPQPPTANHQFPQLLGRAHWNLLISFFAGTALGLGLWAALHFLPDPASAWYQWTVGNTRMGMGAGSRPLLGALADLLPWIAEGFISGNRGLNALEGLLFAAGIGYALVRRTRSDVAVLLVLGGSLLTFGPLFAQKLSNYRVLWTPLLWLLAAQAVLALFDRARAWLEGRGQAAWAAAARPALVFLPLVALYIFSAGWLVRQFRGGQMAETTAALLDLIPPGSTVLGDPVWWFAFEADHRYFGDLYLTYYASAVSPPEGAVPVRQQLTQPQVQAALEAIGAQYVILDQRLHCLQDEDYQPFYALREFVGAHCDLVGEVAGGWYGQPWAITYPLGEKSAVYQCSV